MSDTLSEKTLDVLCRGASLRGLDDAAKYARRRSFPAGCASTLKKAKRVRRIAFGDRPVRVETDGEAA